MSRPASSSSIPRKLLANKQNLAPSLRDGSLQLRAYGGSRHYLSSLPSGRAPSILDGLSMRLMPLGGSITLGVGSSDGNGYRKALYDALQSSGCDVHMVGSRKMGSMEANSHEGWRGFRIDEIERKAKLSISKCKPNLLTLNAGSNDCLQDMDIEEFGKRISNLLDFIRFAAPESTVILSTLVVNMDSNVNSRVLRANDQIRTLADRDSVGHQRIVLADMCTNEGPSIEDIGSDGTHPNDVGYQKMARIWFQSIQEAAVKGYIREPNI